MKFNRTIIITDPCYIATGDDWNTIFDWNSKKIANDIFTDYIWNNTKYGDGSWNVFESDLPEVDSIRKGLEEGKGLGRKLSSSKLLGAFCVDSGTYCIMYLDEVLRYNPKFLDTYGNWCYTVISEFNGDVDIFEDISFGTFHIIGIGNKSFYSL